MEKGKKGKRKKEKGRTENGERRPLTLKESNVNGHECNSWKGYPNHRYKTSNHKTWITMLKSIAQQLERPSGLFGKIVSKGMDMRNRKFYQRIISELDIQKADKVFEIGYGPGLGINLMAQSHPGCRIDGIDFSELMVQMATKRNQEYVDQGIVSLKYGDLLTAELGNEKYDKIFCVNVIYFWKELNPVFTKIYSMLKNGGTFGIFMTSAKELKDQHFPENFHKYSVEEVESALRQAGFQQVEYKIDNGYYIKSRK